MIGEVATAINLIKDFGALGGIIIIGVGGTWMYHKLTTNHFKHLEDSLKENTVETKACRKDIVKLGQRVAKVEGKLEGSSK